MRFASASASFVAAMLASTPAWTLAGPPTAEETVPDEIQDDDEGATSPTDEARRRAGERFMEGQTRFDEHDYAGAIEAWSEALRLLPEDPEQQATRDQLRYALAQAHLEAHRADGEPQHLYRADRLLFDYLQALPEGSEARAAVEAERARIRPQIEAVEAERSAHEAAMREQERRGRAEAAETAQLEANRRHLAEREAGARALIISGGLALGIGAAATTLMVFGLRQGRRLSDRGDAAAADPTTSPALLDQIVADGERADGLALAAGVTATATVVPGVALMVGGVVLRRKTRGEMERLGLHVTPSFSPTELGVGLGGRF